MPPAPDVTNAHGSTDDGGAVLITGASSGIGRACALHLDGQGWRVFAGVRTPAAAQELTAAASPRLTPLTLEVTDPNSISSALAQVQEAAPEGLRGLVNNAGTAISGPLEFLPLDALREQLEINVVGPVAVTQAALEPLRRARGRVINMSSVGGRTVMPFMGPYHASKFAVEAVTDALRRELRPWGIAVVAIEPGSIDTPIWSKGQAQAEELSERLPARAQELYGHRVRRMAELAQRTGARGLPPEAVARAVARALTARHPRSRYVVGRDARAQIAAFTLLPDRLVDRVLDRFLAG
jgi:NAD(P)-dependent dehydrogenase (short-subunit alcohol dehydrogenase family)